MPPLDKRDILFFSLLAIIAVAILAVGVRTSDALYELVDTVDAAGACGCVASGAQLGVLR